MKKIIAITAAAILCLACAACGCSNSEPVTMPTTRPITPTTTPTVPSTILPTMETNIPDPEVNDNSTMGTDIINPTDDAIGNGDSSRARNHSMTGMK